MDTIEDWRVVLEAATERNLGLIARAERAEAWLREYAAARDEISEMLESYAPEVYATRATMSDPNGRGWREMVRDVVLQHGTVCVSNRETLTETTAERDAAIVRAEKAERERDLERAQVTLLKAVIESGRAAHNADRVRADTLMRERDAADTRTLEMCGVHEAEMKARLRAEADNAALLAVLRRAAKAWTKVTTCRLTVAAAREDLDPITRVREELHPGAALLERPGALEESVAHAERRGFERAREMAAKKIERWPGLRDDLPAGEYEDVNTRAARDIRAMQPEVKP